MGTTDRKDYVSLVAEQLVNSLNAEQCTIRKLRAGSLHLVAAVGVEVEKREKIISLDGTVAGEAVTTNQLVCIDNILNEPRYCSSWFDHNGHPVSVLAIPLNFGDEFNAVAQIYSRTPFSPEQITLARNIAPHAGLALRYEQQQKLGRKSILRIMLAVGPEQTYQSIFQHITEAVAMILEIERCAIYKIDGSQCEIIAGTPMEAHGIGLKERLECHPDIASAMESDKITIITSPMDDHRTKHLEKTIRLHGIHQILYVPIMHSGKAVGIMVVDASGEKAAFDEEEMDCSSDIAALIGAILKRDEEVYQEIRDKLSNRLIVLGGYGKCVAKDLQQNLIGDAFKHARYVAEEALKISDALPLRLY